MDLSALAFGINKISSFSGFANQPQDPVLDYSGSIMQPVSLNILSIILGIIIGLFAAYLSFQCNTKMGYNMFLRVIFAILAYLFGLIYLICYVVFRWDYCSTLKSN